MQIFDSVLIDDLRSFKEPKSGLILRSEETALSWVSLLQPEDRIMELWLDHDLGEDTSGNPTSIMRVVRKLEELVFLGSAPFIGKVFVHTSNPVGGNQIEAALGRHFPTHRVYAGNYFIA